MCRRRSVFTLVGVLCTNSVENGDVFLFPHGFFAVNLGPRPLYPVADSLAHVQLVFTGFWDPSLHSVACQGER